MRLAGELPLPEHHGPDHLPHVVLRPLAQQDTLRPATALGPQVYNGKCQNYPKSDELLMLTSDPITIEGRGTEHVVNSVGVQDEGGVGDVMLSGGLNVYIVKLLSM